MTVVLAEMQAADFRNLLPPGLDPAGWHARLTAEIAAHLSPAHAAILARPIPGSGSIAWAADIDAIRRFSELSPADRRALTHSLGTILSRIRRLAESGAAPAVAACWPALREIPDMGMVFAANGAPLLAGWGHVASHNRVSGLLARYDDGVGWHLPPRFPYRIYAAGLLGLAVLAVLIGLLLPLAYARVVARTSLCSVDPRALAALSRQSAEAARHADLQAQLAALVAERGRRKLACAIPPPPPPQSIPQPQPQPAAAPPALPEQQWNRHDLTMLHGCWHRYTNMSTYDVQTHHNRSVREWTICLNERGRGQQTLVWSDGVRCNGSLQASFQNDQSLRLKETEPCRSANGRLLFLGETTCRRVSDREADCLRKELAGPSTGHTAPGRFRR